MQTIVSTCKVHGYVGFSFNKMLNRVEDSILNYKWRSLICLRVCQRDTHYSEKT